MVILSRSEYVRSLVRAAQEAEAEKRLEQMLLERLESGGDDVEANAQFWGELKAEATGLLAKRKKA